MVRGGDVVCFSTRFEEESMRERRHVFTPFVLLAGCFRCKCAEITRLVKDKS